MRVLFPVVLGRVCFIPIIWGILFISGCNKNEDEWPAPTFSSLSIRMASVGKKVVIKGNNFATAIANNSVTFNGTPAEITVATLTSLTMTVPEGATTGPVMVTSNGLSVFAGYFTVYVPGIVTSLSPICGPEGTVITATGNFNPFPQLTQVDFDFKLLSYKEINLLTSNPTQLTFAVPQGAVAGLIRFSYSGEPFKVQDKVTYFPVVPFRLTGYSPGSGQVGSTITITGEFFDTNPANFAVLFKGPGSTTVNGTVTVSESDRITVMIPPGAVTGPLSVRMYDLFNPPFVSFPQDIIIVP